jgi:hypothetical protein
MRKAVLAATLATAAVASAAQAAPFACDQIEAFDPDVKAEVARIATNNGMRKIVTYYRARWDAEHMRRQCEAFAAGQPHDFGCIKPHRDWAMIKGAIPSEYFSLDQRALRPFLLAEQAKGNPIREARQYCRSVGAR